MQTAITAAFLVAALLALLAAFGFVAVASVSRDVLFLAGVFLVWAGLVRLP